MKKLLLGLITIFALNAVGVGQQRNNTFTIYLVRHSEKVIDINNLKDPALTECGRNRSESLVNFFKSTDIDRIYSSDYVRTRETARPLSEARELDTEIYNANKLKEFAKLLTDRAENAIVFGHSNSTPLLAGHLTGKELFGIHENDYSRIYQVILSSDGAILNIFHTTFKCEQK